MPFPYAKPITASFFAAFLFVAFAGCAGTEGITRKPYSYSTVIEVEGSPDQLYDGTSSWMAERFVSSQDAIQLRDPESNKIIAKANREMPVGSMRAPAEVRMNLIVETREGRFRLRARNVKVFYEMTGSHNPRLSVHDVITEELDALAVDLKSYLGNVSEKDDW